MEINPHPEHKRRAIVRVENSREASHILGSLAVFSIKTLYLFRKEITVFPADIPLTYRQLGHIAGQELRFSGEPSCYGGIAVADVITDFFAEQLSPIAKERVKHNPQPIDNHVIEW